MTKKNNPADLSSIHLGKRGYGDINRKGELVIPSRFTEAGDFVGNGLAAAVEFVKKR
ncbi:MAG: WG repeat-containing protein [Zoogloeaceae bacterium]|nr:WG repeat-containing protein [Zoogloeaceae bacterium]